MKRIFVTLGVLIATAYAASPFNDFLSPSNDGDLGFYYKRVNGLRHRRDVSELPSKDYLPPAQSEPVIIDIPVIYDAPAAAEQDSAVLADDGYHYKTIKRIRYRHRRDVSELPSHKYLPPAEESASADETAASDTAETVSPAHEYLPPLQQADAAAAATDTSETAILADDGYHYKTPKFLRYRLRRDVNELPSHEYLPPVQETVAVASDTTKTAILADDGYHYKTSKNFGHAAAIPSKEYIPPVEAADSIGSSIPAASNVAETAILADDGYHYKTSENFGHAAAIPSKEYIPPVEAADSIGSSIPAASNVAETAILADDGYHYKTAKFFLYRHRRDVNELSSQKYLPPAQETETVPAATDTAETAVVSDDGYHYKTIKRIRYRQRRDINENLLCN